MYSEIALKSLPVRRQMENKLISNILKKFKRSAQSVDLKRISKRIFLETNTPFEIVKEILITSLGVKVFVQF